MAEPVGRVAAADREVQVRTALREERPTQVTQAQRSGRVGGNGGGGPGPGALEFPRLGGQSNYAASFSILNFNSNSIGLT